jgi:hypothetical protein
MKNKRLPLMGRDVACIYQLVAMIKIDKCKTSVAKERLEQASFAMLALEPATWSGVVRQQKTYDNVRNRMNF